MGATAGSLTLRAATSLVLSAWLGRRVGGDASILVTLGSAAILSNTGWAPLSSPLYDACWRFFLPGSLVLLLFSLSSSTKANIKLDSSQASDSSSTVSSVASIRHMAGPFILASLGSLLGCLVALLPALAQTATATWLPSPHQARAVISCLLASFIGGSVNFMATARVIGEQTVSPTLMTAMAAADLLVMAVYFGLLGVAVASPRIRRIVTGEQLSSVGTSCEKMTDTSTVPDGKEAGTTVLSAGQWIGGSFLSLTAAGILVEMAHRCEAGFSKFVPGTTCGILALVTPLVRRYLPRTAVRVSPFWSEVSFLTLFASIGLSAHVGSALRAGPGCLILSLAALTTHILVVLGGTALWNRCVCVSRQHRRIELETTLIASNAAIGGPATAAAFAGRLAPHQALAATVWGVVGYATGTTVGVWFYQALGRWMV
jgi:uncharacterized membrane protein